MTIAAVFAIALFVAAVVVFAVFFSIELWRFCTRAKNANKHECQSIQPNQAGKKIQGSKSGWAKNSKSVRKATANKSDWKRNKGSKSREAKASETKTRKKNRKCKPTENKKAESKIYNLTKNGRIWRKCQRLRLICRTIPQKPSHCPYDRWNVSFSGWVFWKKLRQISLIMSEDMHPLKNNMRCCSYTVQSSLSNATGNP